MKNLIISFLILLCALLISQRGVTQGCLPEGITFTTQAEIDSFQINYPGCTEIKGDLTISGFDISNLNGLNILSSLGGTLDISGNPLLTSLGGLDNLNYIGGNMLLSHWDSFDGMCSDINPQLITLAGLENLDSIGGSLSISCTILENLAGLENLTLIKGGISIYANDLTSLAGLENLVSIGGGLGIGVASIFGIPVGNPFLADISAIENIDLGSIESIYICGNGVLSSCEISSICNFLASPNGSVEIYNNGPGCNSQEEVEAACIGTGVPIIQNSKFKIQNYPNPTNGMVDFRWTMDDGRWVSLKIYNAQGQEVAVVLDEKLPAGEHQVRYDASGLPAGVYFYHLTLHASHLTSTGKIVKY